MITYKDPDTGYMCKCSLVSSVPEGVPFKEVPSHERDEFNDAITDYDAQGKPVFDLVKAKEIQVARANIECEAALKVITDQYSEAEMKTWDIQEAEARSAEASPPFLTALATGTGLTVAELKAKVIVKADAFKLTSAQAIAKRQAMEAAALAATTIGELKAVTY